MKENKMNEEIDGRDTVNYKITFLKLKLLVITLIV